VKKLEKVTGITLALRVQHCHYRRRILEVKDGEVRFSWKNYRTGRFRQLKLDIDKFIHRFLLHVYVQPKPGGFRLNGKSIPG
jgi:hypothetical protein